MQSVMKATGISTFDATIPNEIGGMNAFEALLAAHRFNKSTLDTDLVARAYPKVWQTVRCLNNVPIVPAAVADGAGNQEVANLSSIIHNHFKLTALRYSKPLTTMAKPKTSCGIWASSRPSSSTAPTSIFLPRRHARRRYGNIGLRPLSRLDRWHR